MCAQCTVKVRSKNIELVRSNGRVTDTTSAETNLASHLTSCAWRLEQGVEACRSSSLSASRAASPLMQLCRFMVRYAPLLSQRIHYMYEMGHKGYHKLISPRSLRSRVCSNKFALVSWIFIPSDWW